MEVTISLLSLLIDTPTSIRRFAPDVLCATVILEPEVDPVETASTAIPLPGCEVGVSVGSAVGVLLGTGVNVGGAVAVCVGSAVEVGAVVFVGAGAVGEGGWVGAGVSVAEGGLVDVGVGSGEPPEAGFMEMPPIAQWSRAPSEALTLT